MANIDYSAILDYQVGTAPEPKSLPAGTYKGQIKEVPVVNKGVAKKTGKDYYTLTFPIAYTEPGDDIDVDELAQAGGLRFDDGTPKSGRYEMFVDPANPTSFFALDRILASFGYTAEDGRKAHEVLPELVGRSVVCKVNRIVYERKDGSEGSRNEIERIYGEE